MKVAELLKGETMANKEAQSLQCPPFSRGTLVKRNVFRCTTILNTKEQAILFELQEVADRFDTLLVMARTLGPDHPEVIDKIQEYLEYTL